MGVRPGRIFGRHRRDEPPTRFHIDLSHGSTDPARAVRQNAPTFREGESRASTTGWVRHILSAMVNVHLERLTGAFARVLEVIEEGLGAKLIQVCRNGPVIDLGPEHYSRLLAVKRFIVSFRQVCVAVTAG